MGFLEDLQDSWNNLWSGGQHNKDKEKKLKINNSSVNRNATRSNPIRDVTQTRTPLRAGEGRQVIRTPLNLSERKPSRPAMQSNPANNLRNMMDQRNQGITGAPQEDIMGDIIDQLSGQYQGPSATGGGDYGRASIMSALDSALGGALKGINSARDSSNANFKESDANVAAMHSAFQDDIRTNGKSRFNDISNDLVGSLQGNQQAATGKLDQMENSDRAERVAMLKALGIEEAGAAPESDVYDQASADIAQRTNLGVTAGEEQRAGNLSYNEGLATTTGLQGMNRRAELNRQLQQILGGLNSSESDIRTQDANARAAAESDIEQNRQRAASQEYDQWQGSQDNLRGLLDQLQGQENEEQSMAMEDDRWQQEMAMEQSQMAAKNQPEMPKIDGFAQIAQNLNNSGIDQGMSSRAIQLLSKGAADGIFERDSSFSGKINYLIDNGIPDSVALQIVTDYANL